LFYLKTIKAAGSDIKSDLRISLYIKLNP